MTVVSWLMHGACRRLATASRIGNASLCASCPLIGDVRYGKGERNRWFREHYGFDRLALHAAALRFVHPVTGRFITVRAPDGELRRLPRDARAFDARAGGNCCRF